MKDEHTLETSASLPLPETAIFVQFSQGQYHFNSGITLYYY